MKILVLGTGNEIMCDDAVGLVAARELKKRLRGQIDVILTEEAGLSLLDLLVGYDRVIILDAIKSGRAVGEIVEMDLKELCEGLATFPHRVSLPEIAVLGERLGLDMPDDIKVVAMEVDDPYTISEGLTPVTAGSLPHLVQSALRVIEAWQLGTV
jgi:hydrogenase maturation protease